MFGVSQSSQMEGACAVAGLRVSFLPAALQPASDLDPPAVPHAPPQVLLESVREVLSATQAAEPSTTIEELPADGEASRGTVGTAADGAAPSAVAAEGSSPDAGDSAAAPAPVHSGVLYETELLLGSTGEELLYEPPPVEYQDRMADILNNFVASLCSLTRLYGDGTLMEAVLGDKADDVEMGTELQDLVTDEDYDELVAAVEGALQVRRCGEVLTGGI